MKPKNELKPQEQVTFKQQSVAGCCGTKHLYGFGEDYEYDRERGNYLGDTQRKSFKDRVATAAGDDMESEHQFVLTAITNSDDQKLAEKALKSAGFRVMRREINPKSHNLLTYWIRKAA